MTVSFNRDPARCPGSECEKRCGPGSCECSPCMCPTHVARRQRVTARVRGADHVVAQRLAEFAERDRLAALEATPAQTTIDLGGA